MLHLSIKFNDMIDRIKSIMDYYHLSPAQFADKIGFQRSALSHVLSGRNNASLDFVLKVKNTFPNLNLEWLTLGEGNQFIKQEKRQEKLNRDMLNIDFDASGMEAEKSQETTLDTVNQTLVEEKRTNEVENQKKDMQESEGHQKSTGHKAIKKIILLYDDGSFSEHIPEK